MKKVLVALVLPAIFAVAARAEGEAQYKRWKLDFTRGELAPISVQDALGKWHVSYYLTFTLKNGNDRDVPLGLKFKAATDTNQTYLGSIAPAFQAELEKKTGKKYAGALALANGTLAAGESLDGVVFFGEIDANMDFLTVSVYGLYDTIEQIKGRLYHEVKVLLLNYYRPGDEFGAVTDAIHFKGEKWIIEGERKEIEQKLPWARGQ